jgi:membrane protease YdiL (CAAX protease family)
MVDPTFREKSAVVQFLMLIGLCSAGLLFTLALGGILAAFIYNIDEEMLEQIMANPTDGTAMEVLKFMQGLFSIGLFLVPALIAARLFSIRPSAYLGIERFPQPPLLVVGLVGLLTLSAVGVSDIFYQITKAIPIPEAFRSYVEAQEDAMQSQYALFLDMPNTFAFIKAFMLIAVLPALCEETLFRGVLQPVFKKGLGNLHLAVWLTALCFALVHANFYAILSIWVLGAVLGYLREWTGSLWVSILMHLFNNGLIVSAVYFGDIPLEQLNDVSIQSEELWLSILSVVGFVGLLYLIRRSFREERVGGV